MLSRVKPGQTKIVFVGLSALQTCGTGRISLNFMAIRVILAPESQQFITMSGLPCLPYKQKSESLLISARSHRDAKSWGGCCHPLAKRLPAILGCDAPSTNGVIDPGTG
jgi:hypothetical protein